MKQKGGFRYDDEIKINLKKEDSKKETFGKEKILSKRKRGEGEGVRRSKKSKPRGGSRRRKGKTTRRRR